MKFTPARTRALIEQVYAIFPEAQIEFDNDGQIIIYTGHYDISEKKGKDKDAPPNSSHTG